MILDENEGLTPHLNQDKSQQNFMLFHPEAVASNNNRLKEIENQQPSSLAFPEEDDQYLPDIS